MADWKNDKNLGPWAFLKQRDKWAYLNNPRWRPIPREFYHGGPDDYSGREGEEPQIWTPHHQPKYPSGTIKRHHQCGHWHEKDIEFSPVTGLPSGETKASIPLEMIFTGWYYENEDSTTWITTETRIDPAEYPEVTNAWFEVIVDSGVSDVGHYFKLVDQYGSTYATIECPLYNQRMGRVRVGFKLNPNPTSYFVRTEYSGANWCESSTAEARIILDVVNPSVVRIQIPLLDDDQSSPGCAASGEEQHDVPIFVYAYCGRYRLDTYGYDDGGTTGPSANTPRKFVLFKKEAANWDTIDHWDLEVIGGLWNLAEGRVALFNKTTNQMVAGSEITWVDGESPFPTELIAYWGPIVGCHPLRKTIRIENNALNFDNGDEFELRLRAVDGTDETWDNVVLVYSACLYATIKPARMYEVYWRISTSIYGNFSTYLYDADVRTIYEPSKFSDYINVYFEVTATGEAGAGKAYITDVGNADFGAAEVWLLSHSALTLSGSWLPSPLNSGPLGDDILEATEGGPLLDTSASIFLNAPSGGYIYVRAGNFDLTPIAGKTVYQLRAYAAVANAEQDTYWNLAGGLVFSPATEVLWQPAPPTWIYPMRGIYRMLAGTTPPATISIGFNKTDSVGVMYAVNQVSIVAGLSYDIPESEIVPAAATRARYRTNELQDYLTEYNRFITHWSVPDALNEIHHAMAFLVYKVVNRGLTTLAPTTLVTTVAPTTVP